MDLERLRAVLRPKVDGTLILDALTRDAELDFFVMFSSASAIWGSAAAGHYAAANCFEDLLAHDRARRGLPGLAVNWGWWSGTDLVAAEHLDYFAAMGLDVLPERVGLAALDRLLAATARQLTIAPVDWARFRPVMEAKRRRPLLEPMGGNSAAVVRTDETLLKRLRDAAGAARSRLLEDRVQREVAAVLGLAADAPPLDRELGFFDAGLDSIMSVELRDRLQAMLGVELPTTVTFEHPTVASLTAYLLADALSLPAASGDGGDRLREMSEEELMDLLNRELEQR
jgi:acyl carrier protein